MRLTNALQNKMYLLTVKVIFFDQEPADIVQDSRPSIGSGCVTHAYVYCTEVELSAPMGGTTESGYRVNHTEDHGHMWTGMGFFVS